MQLLKDFKQWKNSVEVNLYMDYYIVIDREEDKNKIKKVLWISKNQLKVIIWGCSLWKRNYQYY